jgi:hypothetical protein
MTSNPTGTLPTFDGRDVIKSEISIRKAGDGLSEALQIEPTAFHIGEKVYVVLETEVTAVDHRPIPKAEAVLGRKHVLSTETATIVDPSLVEAVLTAQRDKIEKARLEAQRAKEEAAGVQRVPGTEPWDDQDDDDDLPSTPWDGEEDPGSDPADDEASE